MKLHSVLIIEDDEPTIAGIIDTFSEDKEENGYNIMPHPFESLNDFNENSELDLSCIQMELVCVDYNLPGGVNGNEIIQMIRSYPINKDLKIIFYSFSKNEIELKQILEETIDDLSNIYFVHQDDLEDRIQLILGDA